LDGGSFGPAEYRGKVLVVNFFNPFCPPCREEQPVLETSWRHLRGEGVQFVGVHYVGGDWPRSASAARQYLRRQEVTYPVLEDPDSALARELGIQGIPSTVIIDRERRTRFRILGRVKPGEASQLIASL
jgi:thiol-disulfide isomerase/thioredoxin